ncbi:L-2-hydroxyglutarate oxidase [Salibacterium aidingense]|uniref:L-2-hydroxyglutarate oxidase n=1 Tax=Salibacterium aidingense TaxID=384933 RepID=UPI003BBA4AD8
MYDFVIIGGGIVGLAAGYSIQQKKPNASILVLEKELDWAAHQTGHNSGVIHSGIYYRPGSYKASFARAGNQSMKTFCEEHSIAYDACGKVIVAADDKEITPLENLYQRGIQNGLAVEKLSAAQLKEKEPYATGAAALYVPSTGIVDFKQVSQTLAGLLETGGAVMKRGTEVTAVTETNENVIVETNRETYEAGTLINCAGLHSDRIARMAGYLTDMKIVPFRGEYYKLKPQSRHLVKNLIYPVPNPDFPFLGVHFTRMMNGDVEAGPNAVLGFRREGYRKRDMHARDFFEVMTYRGFWKLAAQYKREGTNEMIRSLRKKKFVESMQKLLPDITINDVETAPAGVRAQALKADGSLMDDFHIIQGRCSLHVCNAPSPAATASLQIGKEIASRVL